MQETSENKENDFLSNMVAISKRLDSFIRDKATSALGRSRFVTKPHSGSQFSLLIDGVWVDVRVEPSSKTPKKELKGYVMKISAKKPVDWLAEMVKNIYDQAQPRTFSVKVQYHSGTT